MKDARDRDCPHRSGPDHESLTCNAHAVAPIQRIPDHRPVRNGDKGLGKIFG